MLNTCVNTCCELIDFSDVKPSNIVTVKVCFRKCVDDRVSGVSGVRNRGDGSTGSRQGCGYSESWFTFTLYMYVR